MTGFGWTLLGFAALCAAIIIRMQGDEIDGLREQLSRHERGESGARMGGGA